MSGLVHELGVLLFTDITTYRGSGHLVYLDGYWILLHLDSVDCESIVEVE